ncbi:MAG: hypothetical protein CSA26_03680 [Desulfobacterales bacterium]|nr:MAG: hypothetical protein CSA26_03680 [Desulfobacterales bacterium]
MLNEEKQLISEVAAGNREAFRLVYEQTYGKVARYIKGFIKDEGIAEDVIIQTYTVVWQKAADFKGTSRLSSWIIGIARNLAFKEFRKLKSSKPFDETYCHADTESSLEPERNDRNRKIKEIINELSPNYQEILEMVFYQGLTYPEIAKTIHIPVNTVKTRVFHAKKAFKDLLIKQKIAKDDLI